MNDEHFMQLALDLAANGRYSTSPNPRVGCVIVKGDRIIGRGFHLRAGLPHAEVEALASCSESAEGSTIYVTLEPCSHHGRTPPCVDALIEAKPRRVVIATIDPDPRVDGRGIQRLSDAAIEVTIGCREEEARRLNETFLWNRKTQRPFVLLKAGMTLDGKLATRAGRSKWITSSEARTRGLLLREEYDAIMVGSGTVRSDDPALTRRDGRGSSIQPWTRIIVHGNGPIPPSSQLLSDGGRTLVFSATAFDAPGVEVIRIAGDADGRIELAPMLDELGRRGITSLLVEGGARLHSSFIEERLWQKMLLFVAPTLVGGSAAPALFMSESVDELSDAHQLRFDSTEQVGRDLLITAYPTGA